MRRAVGLEEVLREPVGHFLVGESWLYFCAHPRLYGIVLFDRPTGTHAEALTAALVGEFAPGVPPHQSLIDARRLESIDPGAFDVLNAYVRRHYAPLRRQVTRLALVRPEGMEGAVVAGFYGVLESPYPVGVFEGAREALAWLGEDSALVDELDALVADAIGQPPLVAALRALLVQRLTDISVEGACRTLGVSSRTLQRRLREAGTTFLRELAAARLKHAQRRMLASDESLTAIALDCGFASLQHMSTLFRNTLGESPRDWRARRQKP